MKNEKFRKASVLNIVIVYIIYIYIYIYILSYEARQIKKL